MPPLNDPGFEKMLGNTIDKLAGKVPSLEERIVEKGLALKEFTMERLQAEIPDARPDWFRRTFANMAASPNSRIERVSDRWPYLYKIRG